MANRRDNLGDRMKEYYEDRSKTYLTRRLPVIIRLDGCAFHTFTRGFDKPFDRILLETMQETTVALCNSVQGCVMGYTQSDEITLVLVDYKELDTAAWYDYSVQKLCSVSAAMATMHFNRIFSRKVKEFADMADESLHDLLMVYNHVDGKAIFDSRCFNIPREEVLNCVLWRIKDANRNSVNSLGQAWFSHKELQGKSISNVQDMLMENFGINWNNLSNFEKTGTLVVKSDGCFSIEDVCIKCYTDLEKFCEDKGIII